MNLNRKEAISLVSEILNSQINKKAEIIFSSPFPYLYELNKMFKNLNFFHTASQNISTHEKGAFTGEVSAEMVESIGSKYTILGHSERREYFRETNIELKQKLELALKYNLKVIFCCGESLSHRDSGSHFNFIDSQLKESLLHLNKNHFSKIIIAYEPIWAIGTGITATIEQAEEMHSYIRNIITQTYDKETANNCSILYGGSCNPTNSKSLFLQKNVDGGLIGGASLNAKSFVSIINSF